MLSAFSLSTSLFLAVLRGDNSQLNAVMGKVNRSNSVEISNKRSLCEGFSVTIR